MSKNMATRRYDFVVLGGGNSGLNAAHLAAKSGRRVAVIDPGPIGGLCNLGGCKPKKILVRATEVLDTVRHSGEHGITAHRVKIYWKRVIERKRALTSGITAEASLSLEKAGVTFISARPSFSSPSTLVVNGDEVGFDAALIATGSHPRQLTLPGAEHTITTDDFMNTTEIPKRMVVIGAGFSAFEFGQVAAWLGAEVDLLHRGARPFPEQEPEMIDALVEFSHSLGLHVWNNVQVKRIRKEHASFVVEGTASDGEHEWAADLVLNASGRPPNLDGLSLDRANVEATSRGVHTDGFLRSTTNRRIFAAGDVHDGYRYKLCTMACPEGHLAARNYLEGDVEPVNYEGVPQVLYTVPPLASVGLTEAATKEHGFRTEIVSSELSQLEVYKIEGEPMGRVKLVFNGSSKKLLGAHLYGAEAGENIHTFAMAVRLGLRRNQLAEFAFACPTRASGLLCMLQQYRGKGLTPH
jgi:glutathione reductase (NADPH)